MVVHLFRSSATISASCSLGLLVSSLSAVGPRATAIGFTGVSGDSKGGVETLDSAAGPNCIFFFNWANRALLSSASFVCFNLASSRASASRSRRERSSSVRDENGLRKS